MGTLRTAHLLLAIPTMALLFATATMTQANDAESYPVLYKANDDSEMPEHWKATDAEAWKFVDADGGKGLALVGKSKYEPKVRSPKNYILLKDLPVTDFVLDVDIKSTTRDYGHRDMCLFFGYQNPEHFYYVHMANAADAHAHSIFLVDNKPRVSIAKERTSGVKWEDGFHHVRLVRNTEAGTIDVYYDDMEKPIMKTDDKTFTWGTVGVGSFDDTGVFANLELKGKKYDGEQK